MHKRVFFLIFFVLLLCAVLSVQSFAFVLDEGKTYAAAVNTNLSIANSPISASYEDAPRGSLQDGAGIYDVCYDPQGNPLVQLAPDLPTAQPLGVDEARFGAFRAESPRGDYVAGESTKTVTCRKTVGGANQYLPYEMKCLWVGTHCTVWGTTTDNEAVRISAENAAIVGQEFDDKYDAMAEAFGAFSIDADGDGKVALLCYDIDGNYETNPNGYYGGYFAGYFWMQDLISADGKIGEIRFSGALVQNGLDCLHLDTYPGMGNHFENVSRCFSTIVHEYQHMINFASRLLPNAVRGEMPTFLDEAFAMAAEHLIYGDQSTQSRVSHFNGSSYSLGSPLTAWQNTLDNYANSYLFGQYLRTRYAQLGFEGDTIYRQILQIHRDTNKDVLEIIGELLGDTPQNIVCDFWLAVALKASYGKYGFGGESWAEKINARLSSGTIHNGGARYYLSTNVPATQNDNLKIIYFDKSNLEHIHLPTATAAVAPTCTAAGNTAYWTCSVCGKFFSDEACTTEIAKDSWILSPIDHTPQVIEPYAATCTESGRSGQGLMCSVCHKVLVEQTVIPPLNHDLVPHEGKAPTCGESGWAAYETCSRCDYTTYQTIPATGQHSYDRDEAVAATCSHTGLTVGFSCHVCGKIHVAQQVTAKLAHTPGASIVVGGETVRYCSVCGELTEESMAGHTAIAKLTQQDGKITLTPKDTAETATVLLAAYSEQGQMVGVYKATVTDGKYEFQTSKTLQDFTWKAFFLDETSRPKYLAHRLKFQ